MTRDRRGSHITLRVDPDVHSRLREMAHGLDCTVSDLLRYAAHVVLLNPPDEVVSVHMPKRSLMGRVDRLEMEVKELRGLLESR